MNNNMERVDLLIPSVINKKITRIAKLIHTTRSEVIRNALRDYLDKKLLELGERE